MQAYSLRQVDSYRKLKEMSRLEDELLDKYLKQSKPDDAGLRSAGY